MNTQYKKGVLELCVLSLLHKRDCYGYEISDFLSQHIDIADGTVYPILRKLKSDGLLTDLSAGGKRRAAAQILQAHGAWTGSVSERPCGISELCAVCQKPVGGCIQ